MGHLHSFAQTVMMHSQSDTLIHSLRYRRHYYILAISLIIRIAFPQGILNRVPRSSLYSRCYHLSPALRRRVIANACSRDVAAADPQCEDIERLATQEYEEPKVTLPADLNSVDNVLQVCGRAVESCHRV